MPHYPTYDIPNAAVPHCRSAALHMSAILQALWKKEKTMKYAFIQKKVVFLQKVGEDAHARQFASMLALLSLNRIFASSND